jgi:putative glutamine amidotransferase
MNSRPHGSAGRRPSIGITPDHLAEGAGGPARFELKASYPEAVVRAGGLPLILPVVEDSVVIETYLDRISGLVITGGAFDIHPSAYGEEPREGLGPQKQERTRFESAILRAALKRNLPVLGICGGMQLLNVVLGGTLFQDIRRELTAAKEHEQKHERSQPQHPVEVHEGSLLAENVGKGQLMVNSTHHQAVNKLGENVIACATAPDGVIEGIEVKGHPFAVGVQWHPEALIHSLPLHLGIYKGLVQKARESRR